MTEISSKTGIEANITEYSVGEISQAVKNTLEDTFEHVRVRGEVGRPNYHSSGHLYFTLKDELASLDAVCWRGTTRLLKLRIEEGMEIVWHKNGQKKEAGRYKDGKQDGLWESWHRNGRKRWEHRYRNGKTHGTWIWWDRKGKELGQQLWEDGEIAVSAMPALAV